MFIVYKSQVPDNFSELVDAHIAKLMAHRTTKNVAVPVANPLIENSIKRVQYPIKSRKADSFIAEFEIVDDTPPPPPPPTLAEKKATLLAAVGSEEQKLYSQYILSPGKQRLLNIQLMDITQRGGPQTPEEEALIAESVERASRMDKIHRSVAQVMATIEDLTEDNIDSYVVPALT